MPLLSFVSDPLAAPILAEAEVMNFRKRFGPTVEAAYEPRLRHPV